MGNSSPCQICVVGFLFGACLTTLFLAALSTSLGTFAFGGISFSATAFSNGITSWNSSSDITHKVTKGDSNLKPRETEKVMSSQQMQTSDDNLDERVSFLYSAWSALLDESMKRKGKSPQGAKGRRSNVPKAPHWENCKLSEQLNKKLDKRVENESFPPWTLWKGLLDTYPSSAASKRLKSDGAYPPWITGSDEENYPLTRKVQRDIWIQQHPPNCSDPNVKFLIAEFDFGKGQGMGAQMAGMCGLLAIAINEKRVLVTTRFTRADHTGCRETSQECRERAWQLMKDKKAREKGIITRRRDYTTNQIWHEEAPRQALLNVFTTSFITFDAEAWGEPWRYMQPTTDVNGTLIASHGRMGQRWWRAQGVRYLMRFQTEYTCNLLNAERHSAFGREAAKLVLATTAKEWLEVGNTSMDDYTASLGRITGTNYPLVNFLMAAEADFFIGAMGSNWSFLIDGMRNTGGKVMAGYLSVNKDRYW
ncbi:hypothetical protein C3L33_16879, partial [Rhododendron williamsianum]